MASLAGIPLASAQEIQWNAVPVPGATADEVCEHSGMAEINRAEFTRAMASGASTIVVEPGVYPVLPVDPEDQRVALYRPYLEINRSSVRVKFEDGAVVVACAPTLRNEERPEVVFPLLHVWNGSPSDAPTKIEDVTIDGGRFAAQILHARPVLDGKPFDDWTNDELTAAEYRLAGGIVVNAGRRIRIRNCALEDFTWDGILIDGWEVHLLRSSCRTTLQ